MINNIHGLSQKYPTSAYNIVVEYPIVKSRYGTFWERGPLGVSLINESLKLFSRQQHAVLSTSNSPSVALHNNGASRAKNLHQVLRKTWSHLFEDNSYDYENIRKVYTKRIYEKFTEMTP